MSDIDADIVAKEIIDLQPTSSWIGDDELDALADAVLSRGQRIAELEAELKEMKQSYVFANAREAELGLERDALTAERDRLRAFTDQATALAAKLVGKVESGMARSRETYAECKALLEARKALEGDER